MNEWEPKTEFEKMAVAIGHHFWKCETDKVAYWAGYECANEIRKALEKGDIADEIQP
jgi:hypothetical protein